MLKLKHVKAICSTETYNQGRQLCQPGKIRKVHTTHIDEDTVSSRGLVLGNFGYFHEVVLTLHQGKRNVIDGYSCDCYEQTCRKSPCRHCVALAMALAVDGETDLGCRLPDREEAPAAAVAVPAAVVAPAEEEPADDDNADTPAPAPAEIPVADAEDAIPEEPVPEEPVPEEPVPEEPVPEEPVPEEPAPVEPTPAPVKEEAPPFEDNGERRSMQILFGHVLPDAPVLENHAEAQPESDEEPVPFCWYPNDTTKVFHTNTGIIGTMGTGKTQFTKSLITQLYRQQCNNFNGYPLGILIFDYKGDYNASKQDFVEATDAKILRPYKLPFNPLAIVPSRLFKPLLPVHTANTFKDTLSKVYRLGPKQQTTLFKCIMKAYTAMGIRPEAPETWKNLAPTFDMVYEIYEQDDEIPKNDSLASAMQKLQQFQIFEDSPYLTESLFELLKGVVVIDLSGYDPDIQSLIVAIILDQFYSQMHAQGSSLTDGNLRQLTKMILVDEADNFMREEFPSLKKIMKEGREFGVGTILSTQFLDHFTTGDDDYSKYILTWIVHNVSDLKKADVEYVFKTKLNSEENMRLYQRIKRSDRFQSVVKVGNSDTVSIRDKAFFELMKETPDE